MIRHRSSIAVASLFLASALSGQQTPAMDPEACAKHCREMVASREKAAGERQAAWKEIEAQLQAAKTAQGEKKVAALESVVEKLVAYQASTTAGPAGCPMASHEMACCGGDAKNDHGPGATGHAGHDEHCPMMKPKPSN
jgi:hypothetical protein